MYKGEGVKMEEKMYIKKRLNCHSCKNEVEFAIKLKNVNLSELKMVTKCSNCGAEIILTPSNFINNEKNEIKIPSIMEKYENIEPTETTGDINSFFEDIEEKFKKDEFDEVLENKKKREYFNDIFS